MNLQSEERLKLQYGTCYVKWCTFRFVRLYTSVYELPKILKRAVLFK
jgi:hypothetical protein